MQLVPHGSPYDIHFSVGPFPVRVAWTHWLGSILLGWNSIHFGGQGPQPVFLALWILIVFVSILVHELGHAVAARWFGYPCHVLLYHFGGLAFFQPQRHTSGREIVISLAGPAAGFLLYGMTWLFSVYALPNLPAPQSVMTANAVLFVVVQMMHVNLFWTVLNLLPVLPLDGGRVSAAVCHEINPRRGAEWAGRISVMASAVAAVALWQMGQAFAGILFLVLAVQNYQALSGRSF